MENPRLKAQLEVMKQRNAELAIATGRLKLKNDALEPKVKNYPIPVVVREPDGTIRFEGERRSAR